MDKWWFRTKPRSILKTFKWFPFFAELEGENWNYKLDDKTSRWKQKAMHPVRRKYIYKAHLEDLEEKYSSFEDYISGQFDTNETESTGRNDKTTFEFYGLGYVDGKGIIRTTKAGHIVAEGKMDENLLIKQLLKIRFPSPVVSKKKNYNDKEYVFPMKVILEIYRYFKSLNKFELGYLFMCNNIDKIDNTIKAINEFRERYKAVDNKLKTSNIVNIFTDIMNKRFPNIKNKPETYYREYSDALIRALEYTGLFSQRGRGYFVKLFIPEHAKLKVKLLQDQYEFKYYDEKDFESYMEWFGDPYNILLPWEDENNIKMIIDNKMEIYKEKLQEAGKNIENFKQSYKKLEEIPKDYKTTDKNEILIKLDKYLSEEIVSLNEELFIKYYSKTKKVRKDILDKFEDITSGNEDMAALWLECNTWKSLVAINGEHLVKRNFKIEEDLSPKAFAPGLGNTPDMELYKNGYILIPEVSLMTGVRQWEHEGSSVIDHVFKFIKNYKDKQVIGLFISSSMNIRTIWQFFILNRESWVGQPVPVIPITIEQYIKIIKNIYDKELNIDDFKELVETIHKNTFKYNTFKEWEDSIDDVIMEWKYKVS